VKISFVIITKNEERNIERCLQSIVPVADEIIVIDSFSEDRTEEICKKYTVRFEQLKWQGYTKTKNYGNSLASYEYIFSIDADEALSEELQKEIISLKSTDNIVEAYAVNRLTNYCGKWIRHCGWFPDWKVRLWNKNIGTWEGLIHETLKIHVSARTARLSNNMLHYSYYSLSDHLKQIDRFTDLMAEDNYNRNKRVGILKLILSPVFKFLKVYFFRLGILDGYKGFLVSSLSSYATFLKNKKTRNLFRTNRKT